MVKKFKRFFQFLYFIFRESLKVKRNFTVFGKVAYSLIGFHVLLIVYLLNDLLVVNVVKMRFLPRKWTSLFILFFSKFYSATVRTFDKDSTGTITRVDLIQLAIRNMKAKKTRTLITISGMSIGIGAIVFLVSLGYGVQNLVTSRVARLDEMSQADVSPQTGGKVRITDETVSQFKNLQNVSLVLPQIAIVGRVNFNNSVSDMAVYGVTSDYLKQSAVKPSNGKIFDSNETSNKVSMKDPLESTAEPSETTPEAVLGASAGQVAFILDTAEFKRVREKPAPDSKILGYILRSAEPYEGESVWGDVYDTEISDHLSPNKELGKWIRGSFVLYEKSKCDSTTDPDCVKGTYRKLPTPQVGYVTAVDLVASTTEVEDPSLAFLLQSSVVLGDETLTPSTSSASATASNSAELEALIASESGSQQAEKTRKVELPTSAKKQAVVNTAMLRILGLTEQQAVGKTFDASFVIVGSLLDTKDEKVESVPAPYTIIGVVPDDKTPYFYVPFIDLRSLGVTTYSQIKVVAKNKTDLPQVRKQIESLGYSTRSVADTVAQINSIFDTARLLLALLGMVALSIASLGMFNTLTVSLLERTREVGLMKAMGMKSTEVRELFLTESMIMGIFGGLFGLLTGFGMGESLSLLLSLFSLSKGAGYLDISYIPGFFVAIIVTLSLVVGIVTGLYPARRATNISALNALRYE